MFQRAVVGSVRDDGGGFGVVFVCVLAETAGMAKISDKSGRQQNDKLQNIIQSKVIRGEMNGTEME